MRKLHLVEHLKKQSFSGHQITRVMIAMHDLINLLASKKKDAQFQKESKK
jgi:hypothetical protein